MDVVCKSCFSMFRISQYLTRTVAILVANVLVSSRLNYCNSGCQGLSKGNLRRLQCLQNGTSALFVNEDFVIATHFAVRSAPTLVSFNSEQKAHLFHAAYPPCHPLLWLCKCFLVPSFFCPFPLPLMFYCVLEFDTHQP